MRKLERFRSGVAQSRLCFWRQTKRVVLGRDLMRLTNLAILFCAGGLVQMRSKKRLGCKLLKKSEPICISLFTAAKVVAERGLLFEAGQFFDL